MRAEIEAVTLGLKTVDDLLPGDRHIIIATDSQSLLRKLETGLSLREWWSNKRITWVYCPGHSGITVNEKADRLAGDGSNCTSRIVLAASDFIKLLRHQITEDENKPKAGVAELERMARLGLRRGWLRRSSRRGAAGRLACQLACGTVSRRTLADVVYMGGAEAVWSRLFGSRPADEAAARE